MGKDRWTDKRTGGWTDTEIEIERDVKLIVAIRNFAKEPKKYSSEERF
jgi:hypothetical protein